MYSKGNKSVGILGTKDAWESEVSNAFANEFKKIGGIVSDIEITLPDSKDTSLPISKVIASKPDAIYLGTYFKFEYFIKKLKDLGYKGKVYSIEVDSYLADITKPYANGVEFISPAYFTDTFIQKYNDIYKEEPGIPAGQAYDATNLLIQIIQKPGVLSTNPKIFKDNIINEMSKVTKFVGVSGEIEFTPDHRATFPLSIFNIIDGKIVKIKN